MRRKKRSFVRRLDPKIVKELNRIKAYAKKAYNKKLNDRQASEVFYRIYVRRKK